MLNKLNESQFQWNRVLIIFLVVIPNLVDPLAVTTNSREDLGWSTAFDSERRQCHLLVTVWSRLDNKWATIISNAWVRKARLVNSGTDFSVGESVSMLRICVLTFLSRSNPHVDLVEVISLSPVAV